MAKKFVTREMLEKIYEANNAMRGTNEYNKYYMSTTYKRKENGKWTGWKFLGWGVPYRLNGEAYVKTVGENTYIMFEYEDYGVPCIERYAVDEAVKALIGLK